MKLLATKYCEVTILPEPGIGAIALNGDGSGDHFFRPVLEVSEHRVSLGKEIAYGRDFFDVDQGLRWFPKQFRAGSSFSLNLSFVMFVRLSAQTEGGDDRWVHLPGERSAGISIDPFGVHQAAEVGLLAEMRPLREAIEGLRKALPDSVRSDGKTVRLLDKPSPIMSIKSAEFSAPVADFVAHSVETQLSFTMNEYWGSQLEATISSGRRETVPVLELSSAGLEHR